MSKPKTWAEIRAVVLYRDDYECKSCFAEATEVDHIWPRSAGGPDELENLQALCGPCNKSKGDGYNIVDATIQELMWLQNYNNRRVEAAKDRAEKSRGWVRCYGPALTQPGKRIAQVSAQRVESGSLLAETFDMLSRASWSGSYGWIDRDQLLEAAERHRDAAKANFEMLVAECDAAVALVAKMDEAGADTLAEYVEHERQADTA